MTDPLLGTVIGGCEILEVIGQGGMGIIYKSLQKSLDRIVALKVLSPKFSDDISFIVRFQREARAIARVNHQNILAVYDVGTEGRVHYMIMELIDGESLAEVQDRAGGPLKLEQACDFISQSANGLEAAQAAGVTHRDIKPENLMVTKKGIVKVSDFGLAKEADAGVTSTDAVMGTPAFMSPEQCDGKKVDGRTDIYSLGASFYRLATGRLPFEAETAMSMMYRHKHEALVPPRELTKSIPKDISDLIVKMMHKKRDQRPSNMAEIVTAIQECLAQSTKPQKSPTAPPTQKPPKKATGRGMSGLPGEDKMDLAGGVPTAGSDMLDGPPPGVTGMMRPLPPSGTSGRFDKLPPSTSGRLPVGGQSSSGGSDRLTRPGLASTARGSTSDRKAGILLAGNSSTDGRILVSRGDELINSGDRIAGLKCYREALEAASRIDQATQDRIKQEIQSEIETRKQAGDNLIQRGMLMEAGREFRVLLGLDAKNEQATATLKMLEEKLANKRTIVNDIRTAIAGLKFEAALQHWDRTPPDLRDESLSKQIDHLRKVIVPSLKLCDKGESFGREGRLEESVVAFQDALRLDENCERARQGLQEGEGKLGKIDLRMKEGYELTLNQKFEEAVEIWMPILKIRPGHPQAIKSIVDAYLTIGQDRKGKGNLKGALKAYSQAQKADPQNKGLHRKLEEIVDLHDKELALTDRAKDAGTRGRRGEAIRYWQEVLRVNPSSKSAEPAIAALKKNRTKSTIFTLILVLIVVGVGGFGYQYVIEFAAISEAEAFAEEGSFDLALDLLKESTFVLNKEKSVALIQSYTIDWADAMAAIHLKNEAYEEAADVYEKAERKVEQQHARTRFNELATEYRARSDLQKGERAILKSNWAAARKHFEIVKALGSKAQAGSDLAELPNQAYQGILFINALEQGLLLIKDKKRSEALGVLKKAQALRPHNKIVKDILDNELKLDPKKYDVFIAKAVKALSEPHREKALDEATEFLKKAEEGDPSRKQLKSLKQYLADSKKCAEENMVLVTDEHPTPTLSWKPGVRNAAFCIDRFEYPNKRGSLPTANLSLMEAKKICQDQLKSLCTARQWKDGCKFKEWGSVWTTGVKEEKGHQDECNWAGKGPKPSGSFSKCHNSIGAFDMSGNLAEWTLDSSGSKKIYQNGGSFASGANQSLCSKRILVAPDQTTGNAQVGFRCCKPLK